MMVRRGLALIAAILLSGCTGTPVPKLAKCSGPYRYANSYGTVLPTLPVPGEVPPAAPPAPGPVPPPVPPNGAASPVPTTPQAQRADPKADAAPGPISALPAQYPSC